MTEEEWQNIRELYTQEGKFANIIYNHYYEEEMRKSRKGPRTTIQWEAKQSAKGSTLTEFQARRTDEILLQVQHDEEGFADEGEAQQEAPQGVPTSEWLIDLAEKTELLPSSPQ